MQQGATTQTASTPVADATTPLPDDLNRVFPIVIPEKRERPVGSTGWGVFVSCVDDAGTVLIADTSYDHRYWEAHFDADLRVWVPVADGERLADGDVVETYPLDKTQPLTKAQQYCVALNH